MSIPSGFLYVTVREGFWSPAVGSPEANQRLETQIRKVKCARNQVQKVTYPYIQPYVDKAAPQIKDKIPEISLPDGRSLWNSGVKKTFRAVADFDPYDASKRSWNLANQFLNQLMVNQSNNQPTATPAIKEAVVKA